MNPDLDKSNDGHPPSSAALLDDWYQLIIEDFICELADDGRMIRHFIPESCARINLESVLPEGSFEFLSHEGPECSGTDVVPDGAYLYRVRRGAGDYFALKLARNSHLTGRFEMKTSHHQKNMIEEEQAYQFIMAFKALAFDAYTTARRSGWWDKRHELISVAEKHSKELGIFARKAITGLQCALEHSELSEGLEGSRKDLMDDKIPEFTMEEAEAADVIIRIMDRACERDLRVAEAVVAKMKMNKTREYLHGGKAF